MNRHLPALILILLNAAFVYSPSLGAWGQIWAWPYTDFVGEAWLQWEMLRQLSSGQLSWNVTHFNAPEGQALIAHFQDYGTALFGAPLTAIFGGVMGMNLTFVAQYVTFGLAFYGLGLALLRDRSAAIAASLLASHTTVLFIILWWGEGSIAMLWTIPVYWWGLLRAAEIWRERPALAGLALGGLLGFTGYLSSYFTWFGLAATGLWLLWVRAWRDPRAALIFLGCWGGLFFTLFAPRFFGMPQKASTLGAGAQSMDFLQSWDDLFFAPMGYHWSTSLDLGGLLSPVWSARQYKGLESTTAEGAVYLGWALVVPGLIGLGWKKVAPRMRGFLMMIGLLGFLIALGPYARYGNYSLDIQKTWMIPLPHLIFAKILPGLDKMAHPYRLVMLTTFVLALGAGALVRGRPGLAAALVIARIAEHTFAVNGLVPIQPSAVQVPEILYALPEVEGAPVVAIEPRVDQYRWAEKIHQASWSDGLEWDRFHLYLQMTGLDRPMARVRWREIAAPGGDPCALHASLWGDGVGVVALVTDPEATYSGVTSDIPDHFRFNDDWAQARPLAAENLDRIGEKVHDDGQIAVWTLAEACPGR